VSVELPIEIKKKKVFGSNEEYSLLQLTYEIYGERIRKEKLGVLCEVFTINCEKALMYYDEEESRYKTIKDYLSKKSIDLSWAPEIISLYFPEIPYKEARSKGWIFREYSKFFMSFKKIDENYIFTSYDYPCLYGYGEFFVFKETLYEVFHCLHHDLVDDNFPEVFENLTEIVKKDKLMVYLKCLKKRHGEPIFVQGFEEDDRIKLLDYLYSDVGGEKVYDFVKKYFEEKEEFDINDLIRFLYLSKKAYKQLEKEV
jgi:hypothetical protein